MKKSMNYLMLFAAFSISLSGVAQKKVKSFKVEKVIDLPAEKIWSVIDDYGSVAYSHPKILASNYINGSLKAEEGAERVCYFNEKHTQFLEEKMMNYNPADMTFVNQVSQAGKFPVDPELTRAVYKVEDLGNGSSKISFDMQFRTKPAMMGGMMKGNFKNLIEDYFIAIEHYARTGEAVTQENFKEIKKQYKA